jgi:cyclase
MKHFSDVYQQADVDGALAASVFHKGIIPISELKTYLKSQNIEVRPC